MQELWLLSAGLAVLLDQLSKQYALQQCGATAESPAGPRPGIRLVSNARLGLGLVRNRGALFFCWGFTVLGTVLCIHIVPLLHEPLAQLGLGAALGGATSNVLDIWRRGAVIDFIDLRIWPVFNLADVAIVAGASLAVWSLFPTLTAG